MKSKIPPLNKGGINLLGRSGVTGFIPTRVSKPKKRKPRTRNTYRGSRLVAEAGFGPATFGLWAQRATGLLHSAPICLVYHV